MTARVLVVDDLLFNLKLLEARLSAEYFEVFTTTNGVDALKICANGWPTERSEIAEMDPRSGNSTLRRAGT